VTETFDLDAAIADESSEPFRFTWGGRTFELPSLLDRDIREQLRLIATVEQLDDKEPGRVLEAMELIVGADVLDQMRELRPVTARAVMALITAWMDHEGDALGKSAASTRSSGATATRSKRTSRSARARRTN